MRRCKDYVKNNDDEFRGEKIFDAYDKSNNIAKCVSEIGESKLSSNLHYKMLIKNLDNIDKDNKDKDNNDDKNKKVKITKLKI